MNEAKVKRPYRTVKVPGRGYATMHGEFYIQGLVDTESEADDLTHELNTAYANGYAASVAEVERLRAIVDAAALLRRAMRPAYDYGVELGPKTRAAMREAMDAYDAALAPPQETQRRAGRW